MLIYTWKILELFEPSLVWTRYLLHVGCAISLRDILLYNNSATIPLSSYLALQFHFYGAIDEIFCIAIMFLPLTGEDIVQSINNTNDNNNILHFLIRHETSQKRNYEGR